MNAVRDSVSGGTAGGISLQDAVRLIWCEADLLDAQDYAAWLAMWTTTGHYIVPIERHSDEFAAHLNVVYDDHNMRMARVNRLSGSASMSAAPSARTVRTVSRFRLMASTHDTAEVRCAQHLLEYKYDRTRILAADVTYRLVQRESDLAIERKVIRLVNSDEALFGIGYLL